MKKRFTDEQIAGFLKEAAAGRRVKDLCRKHGFSDASFYQWRRRFAAAAASPAAPEAQTAGDAGEEPR